MAHLKLKTGDTVMILIGKDKGKRGKITQVFPKLNKVVVEGMNSMTKNIRARQQGEKGQQIQFNAPVDASNVMFIDSKSNQPTRLGSTVVDKKRVRRVIRTGETAS